jgi:2-methylisocitrate lyase-like PEP mutase family enzyme
MQSALETALLLAQRYDSYMEGFALRWAINEFIGGDIVGGLPLERFRQDIAEEAKQAQQIFESFMLYLKSVGDEETRFTEAVRRGKAYMAAGADCLFPFGLSDLKIIAELVKALNVPINIVGRAGGAGVAELGRLGVARISTASGPSLVVMSLIKQIAEELRTKGQFDVLKSSMKRLDVQQLFAARSN